LTAPQAATTGGQQATTMIKGWPGFELNGANAHLRLYLGDCELLWGRMTYTVFWGRGVLGGVYVHNDSDNAKCRHWLWKDIRQFLAFWKQGDRQS
jgi:hypothetical protein